MFFFFLLERIQSKIIFLYFWTKNVSCAEVLLIKRKKYLSVISVINNGLK